MENANLRLLTVVAQRKLGERVLDAALKAGATGATFFYAQGTGVRQRLGVLGQLIEAEKQVVFVVTTADRADTVLAAVSAAAELHKPGYGVAYVQDVLKVVGFMETSPAAT
ncbi:MAG TPA: P-II family nitrogen regulator [Burkholderiales bacterium]|nr:P-II family nitrogen regulator [Burkholderiales bacterium]